MPTATLESLKKRQKQIAEKIRVKEAELKKAERRRRAHILIQVGALIFNEQVMRKNKWKMEDIEATLNDRMGKFRERVVIAMQREESVKQSVPQPTTTVKPATVRQPLTTATTTAKPTALTTAGQPVHGSAAGPVKQSVPTPPKTS